MLPQEFLQIADLLRDRLLLVDSERNLLAVNRPARKLLASCGLTSPTRLEHVFAQETADIDAYLRSCSRSREPVLSTVELRVGGEATRFRCHGALLSPRDESSAAQLLLTLIPREKSNQPFAALDEQLKQLAHEVELRTQTEASLQRHLQLSEFGREFGLVLTKAGDLKEMLGRCTDLLVHHLDAAFARIWVLDERGQTLVLQASSGLYTHLDGSHSRVPIGKLKIGYIAESQTPHLTNQVVGDPRVNEQGWAKREGMVSFAGYPLIVDGATIGVMAMFARHELSESVITAMALVANELAIGISRKQSESALQEKAAALEIADIRKNEFLAMLAHELRNPLAPIRSGLDLLVSDLPESEVVAIMQLQVDHIVRIVDDLLDVSRIMRGRIEMRKCPVLLRKIVERSLATIRPSVEAAGHELRVGPMADHLWVDGDEVRLSQVLTNLLHNAVKYTPAGGQLRVDIQHDMESVAVSVVDNGIGIDPDFVPELFTLFAQASRSLDRSQGGLGIGLTLVKQIVSLHGGSVEASSDGPGEGSTFTFRLPLCEAPHEDAIAPAAVTPSDNSQYRIMVVDDNVASAKLLARLIERNWMHEVAIEHDGESAIATAASFRPNIVFLDIGLPGIDGFSVAKELRLTLSATNTFIVALTGYGTAEDRRKSAAAGFNMHLVKPISIDDLKRILALCGNE